MSIFKKGGKNLRCGLVVDVGSGSVAAAIVVSNSTEEYPQIVWSHREYISPASFSLTNLDKQLKTTLLNVFLEAGNTGLKKLRNVYPKEIPKTIQVSLSSPFAHTIDRTITTKSDEPFQISDRLIKSMETKAIKEARNQISSNPFTKATDLVLLSEATLKIGANGYDIHLPYKGMVKSLVIRQLVSLGPEHLVASIKEAGNKLFPGTEFDFDSFISLFARALTEISPANLNASLVSITAESTEAMTIEEGDPKTAHHISKGINTIARSISENTGLTTGEALSYLRNNEIRHDIKLSPEKINKINKELEIYRGQIVKLFQANGSIRTLPKKIYLHTDKDYEEFYSVLLSEALSSATGMKYIVHPVNSEFFVFDKQADSRILCSAYIFHKKLYQDQLAEELYLL